MQIHFRHIPSVHQYLELGIRLPMWPRLRSRKIVSELFCTQVDIFFSYMLLLKECFDETRHCYLYIFTILKTYHVLAANAIGDCTGDSFVVSGTNNNVPVICGENSGQHSKYQKLKLYNSQGNFILPPHRFQFIDSSILFIFIVFLDMADGCATLHFNLGNFILFRVRHMMHFY